MHDSNAWLIATQARIDAQRELIASLKPGAPSHRTATALLLIFQDSLHILTDAHQTLAAADKALPGWRKN